MKIDEIKKWAIDHQFVMFIISAVTATVILTGVSLWLYRVSGTAGLDLSRPGYEEIRTEVKDDNETLKPYGTTGVINEASVQDFRSRYETLKSRLDATNSYDETAVADGNLGLEPGSEVSEPIQ